jgi:hypothetical protein
MTTIEIIQIALGAVAVLIGILAAIGSIKELLRKPNRADHIEEDR